MYDIYYNRYGDSDRHEIFRGSYMELLDHLSDLYMDHCSDIEYYELVG